MPRRYVPNDYFRIEANLLNDLEDSVAKLLECYTGDVVYDLKTLFKLFGLVSDVKLGDGLLFEIQLASLQSLLGCNEKTSPKDYVIYNARKREFQKVFGIRNSHLVYLIDENRGSLTAKSALAYVRNGFSMLGRNGKVPDIMDLDSYRGNFTPEFYPNRFKMKDCIYQQRLEVLSILINQVVTRYYRAGVSYVEFSVGVNDLLNVDMWKHLVSAGGPFLSRAAKLTNASTLSRKRKRFKGNENNGADDSVDASNGADDSVDAINDADNEVSILKFEKRSTGWHQFLGMYEKRPDNFLFGFIAAFNRDLYEYDDKGKQGSRMSKEDALTRLQKYVGDVSDKILDKMYGNIFGHGNQLENLETALKNPKSSIYRHWKDYVVGLDWVGDEMGSPFCALSHNRFIGTDGIVKKMRNHQPRFGIRVHCGESLPMIPLKGTEGKNALELFNKHITIVHDGLKSIVDGIGKERLRIGHGWLFYTNPK